MCVTPFPCELSLFTWLCERTTLERLTSASLGSAYRFWELLSMSMY
jgi:hypothetical protein